MPETAADLRIACSDLFPKAGIAQFQSLDPDLFALRARPRARDAATDAPEGADLSGTGAIARCISAASEKEIEQAQGLDPDLSRARPRAREAQTRDKAGRFAKGHSGNPAGRPRGIRNPRRRPLALLLRQARPGTLAPLVERKPYLLLPVARLMLPPLRPLDPGDRLGIDFSRMRDADEIAAAVTRVAAAIGRGRLTPAEGARLVRRARKPLRAIRRERWRKAARLEALKRTTTRGKPPAAGPRRSRPSFAGHSRPAAFPLDETAPDRDSPGRAARAPR